jgi:hypothetical protein
VIEVHVKQWGARRRGRAEQQQLTTRQGAGAASWRRIEGRGEEEDQGQGRTGKSIAAG